MRYKNAQVDSLEQSASEEKVRGYRVRVEEDHVSVEHRASFRPRTITLMAIGYLCYCLLPGVRKVLVDFYTSHDLGTGCFALFFLLIPFLFGVTWLLFASGEVMRCDVRELQFARRRTWGRWHRFRFCSGKVRELQKAWRGSSRSRSFTALTFQYDGRTFDMLEEISRIDSDRVLSACKSLGLNVVIIHDPGAAMLDDIDRRGWFINPLRPDHDENQPAK